MDWKGAHGDGLCLLVGQTGITASCFGGTAGGDYRNWDRVRRRAQIPWKQYKQEKGKRVRQQWLMLLANTPFTDGNCTSAATLLALSR